MFGHHSGPSGPGPRRAVPTFGAPPPPNPSSSSAQTPLPPPQQQRQQAPPSFGAGPPPQSPRAAGFSAQPSPQPPRRAIVSPHSWLTERNQSVLNPYPENHQRFPADAAFMGRAASERTGSFSWRSPGDFSGKYHSSDLTTERMRTQTDGPFQNGISERSKRMRSPPPFTSEIDHFNKNLSSSYEEPQRVRTQRDGPFQNGVSEHSKRMRSPAPFTSEIDHFNKNLSSSYEEPQRPDVSPPRVAFQRSSPVNIGSSPSYKRFQPIDYSDIYDVEMPLPPNLTDSNAPKRDWSPPLPSDDFSSSNHSVRTQPERSDVSPSRPVSKKRFSTSITDSRSRQSSLSLDYSDVYDVGTVSSFKPSPFTSPQRSRSPPLPSAIGSSTTVSSQRNADSEMEAKAKRLARFSEKPQSVQHDVMRDKSLESNHKRVPLEKKNLDTASGKTQDFEYSDECMETSEVVIGLCADMCPESEREERERKADLDKYERLDGERNQTSKYIAVKKYTRTAEREAALIRPMEVLQKTIDYLLHLLDRPYDDNLLGIYNFLWDRMRAIRVDLRMQHIFNHQAIVMLEQMIRLHIIVMHELCEYKKGEGFSEGFDAHLNIEQMNKTSVELFEMYDDHRKKGNSVESEKEFRGYYALLKLDKHPGYMVEPAELSLDLAKMAPEIRRAPELLFARSVARACRSGNYISFFRLAKKATYLQACLMHAHFAKVRRQALASLHSGLQPKQGIPVSHVEKWLGMEEEDVQSILEYHGFMLKEYEERYMVKEGPFLNIDADFPTNSSRLVHLKKSRWTSSDIYSGITIPEVPDEKETKLDTISQRRTDTSNLETWISPKDEGLLHSMDEPFHRVGVPTELVDGPSAATFSSGNVDEVAKADTFEVNLDNSNSIHVHQVDEEHMFESNGDVSINEETSNGDVSINEETSTKPEGSIIPSGVPGGLNPSHMVDISSPCAIVERMVFEPNQYEASNEKLRMIIRKWKQRSSILREIREQREFLAAAALGSLSLGPPIQQRKAPPKRIIEDLNIDYVAKERHWKQEKSWSGLNVSDLVAPILGAREIDAGCVCWKLAVFVQAGDLLDPTNQLTTEWLLTKLRGKPSDDGLIVSFPHMSIWKKWTGSHYNGSQTCCLSVIRESRIVDNQPDFGDDVLTGTSCVMFVVSESIPWEIQRSRLHSLIMAVPSGSKLPLLVVSTAMFNKDVADPSIPIISQLGLYHTDKTRVHISSSVLFLAGDPLLEQHSGFFSDGQLRKGLEWLAENSPVQPAVRKVKIHEVMSSYLRHATSALNILDASDVGPDRCISAFNEALARLAEEIIAAASENPNQWPCPSINLLPESSPERMWATMFLPTIGWSSSVRVEPLVRALDACQLSHFPSSMPWLGEGSRLRGEIHNQKRCLEECLASYLTQPSCSMNGDQAVSEARLMVQRGAVVELRGSCYYIVPRWLVIFQRIYNWQLMKLATGGFSEAYVRSDGPNMLESPSLDNTHIEYEQMFPVQTVPPLDEMIEACCSMAPEQPPSVSWAWEIVRHDSSDICDADETVEDCNHARKSDGDVSLVAPLSEKRDMLSVLLERCKQMQDRIDEKLAIYF